MSIQNGCNMNNTYRYLPNFKADASGVSKLVTKPIDKVESAVSTVTDTFEPENEEHKKSYKTAVRVGSTVLVLGAILAIFNPKFSSKFIEKLKTKSTNAANKAKTDNSLSGKWNRFKQFVYGSTVKFFGIVNNGNSAKDEGFKWLCKKSKFLEKPHSKITQFFDNISKHTVLSKYKKVNKRLERFDKVLEHYRDRLTESEKKAFDAKLAEIKKTREYISESNIVLRLQQQEQEMANLEKDTVARMDKFRKNILDKSVKKEDKFNDVATFWAEDSLKQKKEKLVENGQNFVSKITGDDKGSKGLYTEIVEILSPHLKQEEKLALEGVTKKSAKKLRNANKSETIEYFDKKRDLILGSAPTDILTALFSLAACGVALGTADSKEQRLSRTVSGVVPTVCGFGTNIALTAMLVSGSLSLVLGALSGAILSTIGSVTSRYLFPQDTKVPTKEVRSV
ncbi:hypothetical protein IJ750_01935 [bacterium]|nr:hypothetical protein [bacterium]